MTDQDRLSAFDRWLDAEVSGTPEPPRDEGHTRFDASELEAQSVARHIHGMARQADRALADATTSDRLNQIWEDLMVTTAQPSVQASPVGLRGRTASRSTSPRPESRRIRSPHRNRWFTAINTIAAAVLILALAAGIWRAAGPLGLFGDSGDEPSRSQFAALNAQGTEVPIDAQEVPTAADCTVEPLTVDNIMVFLDPYVRPDDADTTASPEGTPSATMPPYYGESTMEVPDKIVAAVVDAQRMWVACNMAGDPFKVWATEDPIRVVEQVVGTQVAGYNQGAIRAELENVAANGAAGTRFELPTYDENTLVPLAAPEAVSGPQFAPSSSEAGFTARIQMYVSWQTMDGSVAGVPGYLTREQANDPAYDVLRSRGLPNTLEFTTFNGEQYVLTATSRGQG